MIVVIIGVVILRGVCIGGNDVLSLLLWLVKDRMGCIPVIVLMLWRCVYR